GSLAQLSQPTVPLSGNSMGSRQMTGRANPPDAMPDLSDREPGATAATNAAARRAAMRGPDDEAEPPLIWLMGAAKSAGASAGWWWVPILLFLLAALYLYARLKIKQHERRKRRAEADY
ncbi:MAG TPA: hypothetical protein VKV04_05490, partial [Verrucomicrobiae bacterium]|nr:hypothetical protein [Verrucomicrobiae bacterium]